MIESETSHVPFCPSVGICGLLVGRSVCHNFLKGAESFTTVLLSEHLFKKVNSRIRHKNKIFIWITSYSEYCGQVRAPVVESNGSAEWPDGPCMESSGRLSRTTARFLEKPLLPVPHTYLANTVHTCGWKECPGSIDWHAESGAPWVYPPHSPTKPWQIKLIFLNLDNSSQTVSRLVSNRIVIDLVIMKKNQNRQTWIFGIFLYLNLTETNARLILHNPII